jgi:hypothetical protein
VFKLKNSFNDEERKKDLIKLRINFSLSLRKQKISEYVTKHRMIQTNNKNKIKINNNSIRDINNKREIYSKEILESFNNYLNLFLNTSNINDLYEHLVKIQEILKELPEMCCKVFYQSIILSNAMKYMIDLIDYSKPPLRSIIFYILSSMSYENSFTELLYLNKVSDKIIQIINNKDSSIEENEFKDMIYLITNISLDNLKFSREILKKNYINILLNYIPNIINNKNLLGISIWSFSSFIEKNSHNSKISKLIKKEQLIKIYNLAINSIISTPKENYSNYTHGGNSFYFSIHIIYEITSKISSDKKCNEVINYPNDMNNLNQIFSVVLTLINISKNTHLINLGLKIINNFIFIDEDEHFQQYLIDNSFLNLLDNLISENKSNSIIHMVCCIIINLSCSFTDFIFKNENLILNIINLVKNNRDIIIKKNAFLCILGLCQRKNIEQMKFLLNNGLIDIISDLMNLCQNDYEYIIQCLRCIIRIIETFLNLFEFFIEISNELNKKGIIEYLEKLIMIDNMNNEIIEMSEFILEKVKL